MWLARKGNPHDIVFSNGRGPRLHHFAYTVGDQPVWTSAQRDLTELALSGGQPFFRYVAGHEHNGEIVLRRILASGSSGAARVRVRHAA